MTPVRGSKTGGRAVLPCLSQRNGARRGTRPAAGRARGGKAVPAEERAPGQGTEARSSTAAGARLRASWLPALPFCALRFLPVKNKM